MSEHLDYVRGAIFLAKNDEKALIFSGGYGFTVDEIKILENFQFQLDTPAAEDIRFEVAAVVDGLKAELGV